MCCKCCVLPCYLVFDEENAQLISSHPSTMSLLLSGILFRIALYQDDQTYKFGQQGQCLLEAITLKSEQWGKDRDWNVPPLQMDSWSIIGKFSTWEGRDGYIISFSSSKIEIFTIRGANLRQICSFFEHCSKSLWPPPLRFEHHVANFFWWIS